MYIYPIVHVHVDTVPSLIEHPSFIKQKELQHETLDVAEPCPQSDRFNQQQTCIPHGNRYIDISVGK